MTKLPPPEQWAIRKMSEHQVADLIERYIDYYKEDENGERRSVHLPMHFVRHFMRRKDKLPTVVAVATMPIVLADGALLAPPGLDRLRGIQFVIQDEVRRVIPSREECTPDAVAKAMKFLCDVWLCDVATDVAGKCALIAIPLTMIERSLLPERPVFFVTAGRRGSGKTTTLTMLIVAATGLRPAASAWSSNEDERRKALLSYFMYGVPYILWDNIPRGAQLSCPHVERSCTSAFYADRKLGVSEMVTTAASTIHLFTGNNVGPKGDLASRSLQVRLEVDEANPEDREFKHPDPVAWTDNHRAELIRAFYTILLGNPTLSAPRDAPMKTRFKMWWRLVGSAVENAAKQSGYKVEVVTEDGKTEKRDVDFSRMFHEQGEEDEEDVSLFEVLATLQDMFFNKEKKQVMKFTAHEVCKVINTNVAVDATQADHQTILREFLFPTLNEERVSPRAVGKALKRYVGNAVQSGGRTLILKEAGRAHGIIHFQVHGPPPQLKAETKPKPLKKEKNSRF